MRLHSINHTVDSATAFVIHSFLVRSIHLLEYKTCRSVFASRSSSTGKIVFATIATPIFNRFQLFHTFTGCYSRKCSHIVRTIHVTIFISSALKHQCTIVRVIIERIGKGVSTFQTIAAHRRHIGYHVVTVVLFHQIIVIEKPARTIEAAITIHIYIHRGYFTPQTFQFLLFVRSERFNPVSQYIIQQTAVRDSSRSIHIQHRTAIYASQLIPFVIIEISPSEIVHQCFHISSIQLLCPRSAFQ